METRLSPTTPLSQLHLETSCPSPGTIRVVVAGEIDHATAGRLRVELLNVLFTLRPHRLEIELAEVTFLDCGGVTVLIVAGKIAAQAGCQLRIMNPQAIVRRVLSLTGLLGILTAEFGKAPLAVTGAGLTASAGIVALPEPRALSHAIKPARPMTRTGWTGR